jgi:hypothetical protein
MPRSPAGRTIIVHGQDENFSVLDLLLLTEATDVAAFSAQSDSRR